MPEPDYIGVGALGAGNRWWHGLLLAHPEIAAPAGGKRALHFFDRFCAYEMEDADVERYHAEFPSRPGVISGEWTGRYMFDAWTLPLLRRAAPEAKLLVMLSDPIERYRTVFAARAAVGDLDQVSMRDFVDRRTFGAQLARLHRFYDPSQILVLQFERCMNDPLGEYRRTLEFLGVRDTAFQPRRVRRNVDDAPSGRLAARLLGRTWLRRVAARVTGRPLGGLTKPLWPDMEHALRTAFDADVALLPQLAPGFDLSLWPNFADGTGRTRAA